MASIELIPSRTSRDLTFPVDFAKAVHAMHHENQSALTEKLSNESQPISKDWLISVGFCVTTHPDKRKSQQMTKFVASFPSHLCVEVHYWEYPRSPSPTPDGVVVSTATFGGGPLVIPSEVMKTRGDLVRLIHCLCGVELSCNE